MFWNRLLQFVKSFEGFFPIKYKDVAGIDTFGYGSLVKDYPYLQFPVTEKQATEFLQSHLKKDLSYILNNTKVVINDNQKIALTDFVYNLGRGAYQRSTLRMQLNRGELDDASYEFLKWDKARVNGILRSVKGLTRRRIAEREIFDL